MNELTTEDKRANVIKVQFKRRKEDRGFLEEDISDDVSHPASKNFPEFLDDDPLYDLLHEFDDVLSYKASDEVKQEDYIFHLVGARDIKLEVKQKASEMGDVVLSQVERLKEDFKRIKFYLDEMNIDD